MAQTLQHTKLAVLTSCTSGFCSVHRTEVEMVPLSVQTDPLRCPRCWTGPSPRESRGPVWLCSDRLTWCCKHSIYLKLLSFLVFLFCFFMVTYVALPDLCCWPQCSVSPGWGWVLFQWWLFLYKVCHGSFPLKRSLFFSRVFLCVNINVRKRKKKKPGRWAPFSCWPRSVALFFVISIPILSF